MALWIEKATEENGALGGSGSPGHESPHIPANASSMGCKLPDQTAVRKVSGVEEHRDNYPLDNDVPAQDSGTDAAPQTPSILEPTYIRLPEGSASVAECYGVEEHRDNSPVDNSIPAPEAGADAASQAPPAAQAPTINSVPDVDSEVQAKIEIRG
ncbi:hypothetical protein HPB52_003553 [Rhipicephalus sanguineus]|uniref:Uncharacterized protein n=1 Tax=Rhipicephalus sanguineus TaxID=34632 RepID=A0A9D4T6S6_RHISA|nr:hypothetical protein HPB52_003553 [Rhipicephalus sanguineus]